MTRATFLHLSVLSLLSLSAPAVALNTACYNDLGSLTPSRSTTPYQSVALCQQFCTAEDKSVYAVQAEKCFCGETLPPLSAKVSNTECTTKCPGYPAEKCGGKETYTIGMTSKSRRSTATKIYSESETEAETDTNGILTAPDVDEDTPDPLASLSVNPTMVKTASSPPMTTMTATGTDTPKTSVPSTILTAPSGTADPDHPDTGVKTSSSIVTSAATVSPSASTSGSAGLPSASVVSGGASVVGRGVVGGAGGLVLGAGFVGLVGLF
ncbi:hypothetical protein BDV26DRAFT_44025 [Aspergillus bertholletiae]|uniref:WSC domain-containing protein n=1 Tax=Aspergillus bertholletiae TaxID=1226010 RepID=A0A5N7AX52_9EURO|nr:hypothetical protein BDV26DRAFT_44025 [Aspergillus bertholletiae]